MRRFEFTEEEKHTIAQERYHHPDPRVQQRMEILWLKSQGERHERIAQLAGVGRRTVQRVLDLFEAGRLEGDCKKLCGTGFQPVKKHGQDGRATSW